MFLAGSRARGWRSLGTALDILSGLKAGDSGWEVAHAVSDTEGSCFIEGPRLRPLSTGHHGVPRREDVAGRVHRNCHREACALTRREEWWRRACQKSVVSSMESWLARRRAPESNRRDGITSMGFIPGRFSSRTSEPYEGEALSFPALNGRVCRASWSALNADEMYPDQDLVACQDLGWSRDAQEGTVGTAHVEEHRARCRDIDSRVSG